MKGFVKDQEIFDVGAVIRDSWISSVSRWRVVIKDPSFMIPSFHMGD
jgi:hypothetical protein